MKAIKFFSNFRLFIGLLFFFCSFSIHGFNIPTGPYRIFGISAGFMDTAFPEKPSLAQRKYFGELEIGHENYFGLWWYGYLFDIVYKSDNEIQLLYGIDGALTLDNWFTLGGTLSPNIMYKYSVVFDYGLTAAIYFCMGEFCAKFKTNFYSNSAHSSVGLSLYWRTRLFYSQ